MLLDSKLQMIVTMLQNEGAEKIGLFGSCARGTNNLKSDIDILVRFDSEHRKSLMEMVRIQNAISDAVHQTVDLLTERAVSPYLVDRIKAEEKVLYG